MTNNKGDTTMNLKPIQANMTELTLSNGDKVLFSYRTPVAAIVSKQMFQTDKKWSRTTSRHISQWINSSIAFGAMFRPQDFFDNLIKEVA